jgi:protein-disulfide isomerase
VTARVSAATAVRVGLAAVWAYAAVRTIGDPAAAVRAARAYGLPPGPAEAVGRGLPFLELGLAALLLAGLAVRVAAAVSAVLSAVLLAGIVSAAARGLRIGTGWFGGGGPVPETAYPPAIAGAAVLLALSAALARWPRTRYALDDRVRAGAVAAVPEVRVGPRRTADARRRAAELERQRAAAGERRVTRAGALAGVALVLLTGAGIGLQAARGSGDGGPSPQAVGPATGVVVGRSSARVTIEVYQDPHCTECAAFARDVGPQLAVWERAGVAQVQYKVLSVLDSRSTTKYSSRAANALYCAADAGAFPRYQELLFDNQPPAGSAGLPDGQLVAYGQQAGAGSAAFRQCVENRRYGDFVARITDQASRDGVLSTPTVFLDGEPVQPPTLAALNTAVAAAT